MVTQKVKYGLLSTLLLGPSYTMAKTEIGKKKTCIGDNCIILGVTGVELLASREYRIKQISNE